MDSELRCSHCGASLKPGDRFCPSCGKPTGRLADDSSGGPIARSGERPKHRRHTSYWLLGCGCGLVLLAIVIALVVFVVSDGSIADSVSAMMWERRAPVVPELMGGTDRSAAMPTATRSGLEAGSLTATMTKRPSATSTEHPTAQTRTEATAAPRAAAPVLGLRTRGDLLYQDDFSDSRSGWDQFSDGGQTVGYVDGNYVIRVHIANWMTWGNAYQWFEDGIVAEVDATKVGGPDDNGFGLVLGYQDTANFYRFEIASDGYYRVGKYVNDEWIELIPWAETGAVKQGNATNTIAAEMAGGTLALYANSELLGTVRDFSFVDGDVGLVAGSFDTPNVHIAFDNLRVYALR
jgi:hypothetical protein